MTTFLLTSDTMQVLCERLQAERAFVAEAYAVYMEAEAERRSQEAAAAAATHPQPAAAHPQPAPVPQWPWPPPPGVAASSQPPPPTASPTSPRAHGRRVHPLLLFRPPAKATGRAATPRLLRGSCLEGRPTRCSRPGTRQGSRPSSGRSPAAR